MLNNLTPALVFTSKIEYCVRYPFSSLLLDRGRKYFYSEGAVFNRRKETTEMEDCELLAEMGSVFRFTITIEIPEQNQRAPEEQGFV